MNVKRIVIKVGTSSLTHSTGKLNIKKLDKIAYVLSDLKNQGYEVALVSSGAVGVGVAKLGLMQRPDTVKGKQAAAAVGQCELMYLYDKFFSQYHQTVAQVLLSCDFLDDAKRKQNITNTFEALFELQTIPIINENDTVATEELTFGDNDMLSAHVATLCKADLLILMTDTDGLYDKDPKRNADAKRLELVEEFTPEILAMAGEVTSKVGTGGMRSKVCAAHTATSAGIHTCIVSGDEPDIIYSVLAGERVGTTFLAKEAEEC